MRLSTKICLITAASLILLGCLIFVGALAMANWNFLNFVTAKYETNSYSPEGEVKNISVITNTADVSIIPTDSDTVKVVCYDQEKNRHEVTLVDGELKIERKNTKKWYDYIEINFESPKIEVYLPRGEYSALSVKLSTGKATMTEGLTFESVKITASTGDVKLEGLTTKSLELKLSTGKTTLNNVNCDTFSSTAGTGDIILKNLIAKDSISIKRSTGDVKLDSCDASELTIQTDTGDVTGTLLSSKIFITHTSTGKVSVPETTEGGKCKITTSTGNIKISINK